MRRPQGYVSVVGGWQDQIEHDTVTCGHCNAIVLVKPGSAATVYVYPQLQGPAKEEAGAMCRVCMSHVCLRCHDRGVCTPLMRRIEDMEDRRRNWHEAGVL